jgi:hypothetical protein
MQSWQTNQPTRQEDNDFHGNRSESGVWIDSPQGCISMGIHELSKVLLGPAKAYPCGRFRGSHPHVPQGMQPAAVLPTPWIPHAVRVCWACRTPCHAPCRAPCRTRLSGSYLLPRESLKLKGRHLLFDEMTSKGDEWRRQGMSSDCT